MSTSSTINTIKLRSKVLLNISDILARDIEHKFGCIIGCQDGDNLIALTSFEILPDSTGNSIDTEYLFKRYNQLKLVYPECQLIGVYYLANSGSSSGSSGSSLDGNTDTKVDIKVEYNLDHHGSFTLAMCQEIQQFCATYGIPLPSLFIYLIYQQQKWKFNEGTLKNLPFQGYLCETSQPIATEISISETESIAVSTIVDHKDYYSASGANKKPTKIVDIKKHVEDVSNTLKNLEQKLVQVSKPTDTENESKSDLRSSKLSKNEPVSRISDLENAKLLKLQTMQLALLTEQKLTLETLQSQGVRHMHPPWVGQ